MNNTKLNFEQFIKILHELDEGVNQRVLIRAIGGFSIILNSAVMDLGIDRMSQDIDSLTKVWSNRRDDLTHYDADEINRLNRPVDEVIREIGEKYGINGKYSSWLNNSWYDTQMYYDELEEFIEWKTYVDEQFKHIKLQYADLESVFLFKMRAINDTVKYDRPRDNDLYDVLNIMRVFEEKDFYDIRNAKMANAMDMYPDAINWLKRNAEM